MEIRKKGCISKELISFSGLEPAFLTVLEKLENYIKNDSKSELFSGEHVSQLFGAEAVNLSSCYLMRFSGENEQQFHYHSGERILIIFAKKNACVRTASIKLWNKNRSLEKIEPYLQKIDFTDYSISVLKMDKSQIHQFSGDFVAFSIHPQDSKEGSTMGDETVFIE